MGWQKCSAIRISYLDHGLRLLLAQSRLSDLVVYYQGMCQFKSGLTLSLQILVSLSQHAPAIQWSQIPSLALTYRFHHLH